MPTVAEDVDRHERALYGGNGNNVGLLGRVKMIEDFIVDLRAERKEAREDRRKILVTVVSAALVNIVLFVISLLITHPETLTSAGK